MAKRFDRHTPVISGAASDASWAPSRRSGRRRSGGMSSNAMSAARRASLTTRVATRHCPKCQGLARAQWLAERQAELLSVPYFHVVFTLPAPVGEIAFQNKALVYAILFHAAAETLATIAADPKHLGAQLGVTMVLHTWGQTLQHHPHVHCIVPGSGLSLDNTRWIACRRGFFLPVRVLSRLFRRLFLRDLQKAFDTGNLHFFGKLSDLADPEVFAGRLDALQRLGCLRQAPIRRTRTGASLSRPLHASGRHRQQPADLTIRRQGPLYLEGLSPGRQDQNDDAGSRRVHPALLAAHPAGRLPSHPPLWLPRQWRTPPRALSSATCDRQLFSLVQTGE